MERPMGMDDDAQIFSIIGGAKRSGRWRVPASTRTMTLFGRCLIDLRQAETTADELSFSCVSAFAGVTFIVPEGAEVRPSGMAILGSARSLVPVSDTPAHLPPISIDAVTVMGRLRIRTTDEEPEEELRDSWRERRRAKKEAARAEKAARAAAAAVPVDAAPASPTGSTASAPVGAEDLDHRCDDPGERVDLAPVEHREPERELVDLKPVIRAPSISAPSISRPGTDPDDEADAAPPPDLFERPRISSPTVDPVPVGSIDDHPTAFGDDDQSPLEDLHVPDTADGIDPAADDDVWGDEPAEEDSQAAADR